MATFKSPNLYKGTRARPIHDGLLHSVSGSILIPSGTTLGASDVIRLFRIHPKLIEPTRVIVDVSGTLDGHGTAGSRTLKGTLGILKSSNAAGTNLSFKVSATTTAATEDSTWLLAAATTPLITTTNADFGNTAGTSLLTLGGVCVFNPVTASAVSRGYDANVMDVAISMTAASSTATTADRTITVTLEYMGVASAVNTDHFPYLYRYNSSGVSS